MVIISTGLSCSVLQKVLWRAAVVLTVVTSAELKLKTATK